jgi:uncharacterized repeat protein (TIGR03943 family)
VILLFVGATLIKVTLTGAYLRYVRPGVRPLLIAAGAILIVLAVTSVVVRRPGAGTDDGHTHAAHPRHRFDVAWLLVAPMLALLVLAPPALGGFSASRAGTAVGTVTAGDVAPLPSGDPVRISVLDYASRAVLDHGASLRDRHVTLSGFLLPGPHGAWYLTRMVITCCAADAQPVKVGLTGHLPAPHANDWIEVTGGYTPRTDRDEVNAETIPYLDVQAAHQIPVPVRPYD